MRAAHAPAVLEPGPEARPSEARAARPRAGRVALGLFLGCLAVYNANGREISSADTVPSRLLPVALLRDGTLHLDRLVREPLPGMELFRYSVKWTGDHHVSAYPVVGAVFALPVYAVGLALAGPLTWPLVNALSKVSASALAAGSVAWLYLALRRLADPRRALVAALVYAFATGTWSVSSQGLWQHGPAQFLSTLALYLVLGPRPAWAGLVLGPLVAARPPTLAVAGSLLAYLAWRDARIAARAGALALVGLLPVLLYNVWYFGAPEGGYAWIQATNRTLHFVRASWTTWPGPGLAGLLVSPNRGLLVYSPVLAFALVALALAVCRRPLGLLHFLAAGWVGGWLTVGSYTVWWGGHSFGPRYLTDFLPVLAVFLLPALAWLSRCRALAAAFVVLAVASVAVQAVGVLCYPSPREVEWNKTPRDVDAAPERAWDWRDPQLLRLLRNGPRPAGFGTAP